MNWTHCPILWPVAPRGATVPTRWPLALHPPLSRWRVEETHVWLPGSCGWLGSGSRVTVPTPLRGSSPSSTLLPSHSISSRPPPTPTSLTTDQHCWSTVQSYHLHWDSATTGTAPVLAIIILPVLKMCFMPCLWHPDVLPAIKAIGSGPESGYLHQI